MKRSAAMMIAAVACAALVDAWALKLPMPDYSGIWWNYPAGSESGWGVVIEHQDRKAFAAWLTYDASGEPTWFFMPQAVSHDPDRFGMDDIDENTFQGDFYAATAEPVRPGTLRGLPRGFSKSKVGSGGFHFNPRGATVFYPGFGLPAGWKDITPFAFAAPTPHCSEEDCVAAPPNYQGLWASCGGIGKWEWGIHISHQGDLLFAVWLTYGASGKAEWFSMDLRLAEQLGYFYGEIYKSTGPSFDSAVFDPALVKRYLVGYVYLDFGKRDDRGTLSLITSIAPAMPPVDIERVSLGDAGTYRCN